MSTFVIAEMASCHDGSLDRAKRLVDVAVESGADAAKIQFWSDAGRLADRRKVPAWYRDVYRRYRVPADWLPELHAYCGDRIEFMSTVFLPEDVQTVAPFVQRFKVSSFEAEAVDLSYAILIHGAGRQTIVSLGMGAEKLGGGFVRDQRFLHCVSSYPADPDQVNLARLRSDDVHGLSDHSRQLDMGALAVAAGAEIIEAHVRLDDTDAGNLDHDVAFTPAEFAEYVRLIRRAERIMGTGEPGMQPCEEKMAKYRVVKGPGETR